VRGEAVKLSTIAKRLFPRHIKDRRRRVDDAVYGRGVDGQRGRGRRRRRRCGRLVSWNSRGRNGCEGNEGGMQEQAY
jgi:hypothetical protein